MNLSAGSFLLETKILNQLFSKKLMKSNLTNPTSFIVKYDDQSTIVFSKIPIISFSTQLNKKYYLKYSIIYEFQ